MFAISLNWICEILKTKISLDEIMNAFNTQGFEVKSVDEINEDYLITIEVKANRPDMLSHYGVAREVASFMNIKIDKFDSNLNLNNVQNDGKIDAEIDEDICDCFCLIKIEGINNKVKTPDYIKNRLEFFGINSISAVVDISNYIAIEMGQPTHAYDYDKISGNLFSVCKSGKKQNFETLAGATVDLEENDILICDREKPLCLAGVIGSSNSEISENSQNIVIESAVFSKIAVRKTAKRLRISSLASFRFERGVDPMNSCKINKIFAERIIEICGGKITYHFEFMSNKIKQNEILLRTKRVNSILGTNLNLDEISNCLEKYNFECNRDSENFLVKVPSFRMDIESEIDLIEEVARGIGYDNIAPKNMNIISNYRPNLTYEKIDKVRNILNGFGFNEVINYSFIPENAQKIFNLSSNNCIFLQNPLSNSYNLMRPNLIYSLLYSLSYNYSIGNFNLALYENGKVYKSDKFSKNLSNEENVIAFIISGNRIEAGFGINKSVKFGFYDMTSYLNNIFSKFNVNYNFEKFDCNYLENSYFIKTEGRNLGFMGKINKNMFLKLLPNLKLVKDDIFYCEINIEKIKEKNKYQKFESKFPAIVRMYNLVCNKNLSVKTIIDEIFKCGSEIHDVKIRDIYKENVNFSDQAILFEICFWLEDRTLKIEEIEQIEHKILNKLNKLYDIRVKR